MTKKKSKKKNSVSLNKFVKKHYYRYGVEVNEDRAIPSPIDGLKPVARRTLWAAYKLGARSTAKLSKSARIVGEVIGLYHPHGDSSVYDALVKMANSNLNTIEGVGNFGRFNDKTYAAMRYTNARLSKYSDKIFFDSFYLSALQLVPNFDGSTVEPIMLAPLLPNLLLNGTSGIGVGLGTSTPTFSFKSVLKAVEKTFENKGASKDTCKVLELSHVENAVVNKKLHKKEFSNLLETGKGRFIYNSVYKFNEKTNVATFTGFAFNTMQQAIRKAESLKNIVQRTIDMSGTENRHGVLDVYIKKSIKGEALKDALAKLEKVMSTAESYNIKVTERTLSKLGDEADIKLADYSVIDIMQKWYEFRIDLEKFSCGVAIDKCNKQINDLKLKVKAVDYIDEIVKLLKAKGLDDKAMSEKLSKIMKVTVDEAFQVLCMQVRSLKALEKSDMLNKIKDLEKEIKRYNKRIKKPDEYILTTLKSFEKLGD